MKTIKKRYIFLGAILLVALIINFTVLATSQLGDKKVKKEKEPTLTDEQQGEKDFANAGVFGEYNVLLLGIDSRSERGLQAEIDAKSYRTDTMILATLDIKNNKAKLISIPRDTKVKVKGNYNKINAAFVYGGIDLAKETVEKFAGVEIDRTMVVDFHSLVKLVDILGGVQIDVPSRMYRPTEDIDLKKGIQILDGHDALAYSRYRGTAGGDIDRASRQQEVIQALMREIVSVKGVAMIPSLYKTMEENIVTDIPLRELITLGKLAPAVLKNGLDTMVVPGKNALIEGIWFWEADKKAFIDMLEE